MRYNIYGKNFELTSNLKDFIYRQFEAIEDFFDEDTVLKISIIQGKKSQKIEATINYKGRIIRAEKENNDIYIAIQSAVSVMERQIIKYKNKFDKKCKSHENIEIDLDIEKLNIVMINDKDSDECISKDINIKKEKEFTMRPMTIEDACIQLELLGHEFYMFLNMNTRKYNVVYKRNDEDGYGLISPA